MAETDSLEDWNADLEDEVSSEDLGSLIVYSRDWTVETIISQIHKGNIDLSPAFQRRNAWNDHKRSKLIESLIIGVPVPEIVLAEDKERKGSFIVIDGKQRLLAMAGFFEPEEYPSWKSPKLCQLNTRRDLNNKSYADLVGSAEFEDDIRQLLNDDVRCTVISNYKTDQILYDIFYRLNTGSVPLSSQELRQVLKRGEFANYLLIETGEVKPLHQVMRLAGPDPRLRDAEILLRYIGLCLYGQDYKGNLTQFLDLTMERVNLAWNGIQDEIEQIASGFHAATALLCEVFPDGKVARKFSDEHWESRFNRALFEVEVFYFSKIDPEVVREKANAFIEKFKELSLRREFAESIESTTKTRERYYVRFSLFQGLVNEIFNTAIDDIPTPKPEA